MMVGIVRGPFLNKFEMQSYEPLMELGLNVTAFFTNDNIFDVKDISLPKVMLSSLESITRRCGKYLLHPMGYWFHMVGLEKALFNHNVDVVHTAETFYAFSYQAIKAKEKYNTKVVVTHWENIPFNHEQFPLWRKLKRKIKEKSDLFVAPTNQASKALILEGVSEEKIRVIYPGVDLDRFKPGQKVSVLLSKWGFDEEDLIILFVGRLVKEKGVYDLVLAFKRLLDDEIKECKIKLILVGAGPEKSRLIQITHQLHLSEYLKFDSLISYKEIHRYYNSADIVVLPSKPKKGWCEQFGMVLIEAMACGKPILSTKTGAIPEVIGNAGITVSPNDQQSFYEELKLLILNEELRSKLSQISYERANSVFDARNTAKMLADTYNEL